MCALLTANARSPAANSHMTLPRPEHARACLCLSPGPARELICLTTFSGIVARFSLQTKIFKADSTPVLVYARRPPPASPAHVGPAPLPKPPYEPGASDLNRIRLRL